MNDDERNLKVSVIIIASNFLIYLKNHDEKITDVWFSLSDLERANLLLDFSEYIHNELKGVNHVS